jgi:hypothetical protein
MTAYQITNRISGEILGVYRGISEDDALDAMARDAGYADYAACCAAAPAEEGEIQITEMEE